MEKKLSEYIEAYRIDRPDEWTMDEFVRKAVKLEAERNELAAQVEAFGTLIHEATNGENAEPVANDGQITGYVVGYDWLDKAGSLLDKSPQHHLRQVRADAVMDAINNGFTPEQFHALKNSRDGVQLREDAWCKGKDDFIAFLYSAIHANEIQVSKSALPI